MHPLTDIIVLCYNNRSILPSFLKHLYNNTTNFNLIFVDNNSQDDSVEFIKEQQEKHDNITVIRNQINRGVAGGRNDGIKAGKAEFVINLDSDQLPTKPNWLDELFVLIGKGFDFVGVEGWVLNPPTHPTLPYYPSKHCDNGYSKITYVGGGGCLMKRDVFEKLGYYDERFMFMYFEDPDIVLLALKNGYKVGWNWMHKILHLGSATKTNYHRQQQFQKSYKLFKEKWHPWFPKPISMVDLNKWLK